ncbi:hypothetical protein WN943_018853 [Citrus x changshan-huyou]
MLRNYMDFSFYLGIPMLGTMALDLGYILWKCLFKSLLPFVWADDYFLPLLFPLICRWRGFNPRFKPVDRVQVERKLQNKERTLEEHKKLVEKILKRDQKRRKRIEAAGIEYECPEIVGNVMPAPKKIKFNEGFFTTSPSPLENRVVFSYELNPRLPWASGSLNYLNKVDLINQLCFSRKHYPPSLYLTETRNQPPQRSQIKKSRDFEASPSNMDYP